MWTFYTGFWASEGIRCSNAETSEQIRFVQETPIASWQFNHAIHLEGDIVLFQLGEDQICILQVESRKITKITRGKIPLVIKINQSDVVK